MTIINTVLEFLPLSQRLKTSKIILHHSAAVGQSVGDVHNYHKNVLGWSGIAYHFYVRQDGRIYQGRPIDTIGGHTSGENYDSIGICAEGNFEVQTMPETQKQSIIDLLAYLKQTYDVPIKKHSAYNATACPGANYPYSEIVKAVDNYEDTDDTEAHTASEWAEKSWNKAVSKEVFDGTNPQGAMTREMLAVVLDRVGVL